MLIDSPSPLVHVPLSPALIDKVLDNLEPESQEFCKIQLLTNSQLLSKYSPRDVVHTRPLIFLMSEKPYAILGDVDIPPWLSDRRSKSSIIAGWEFFSGGPFDTFHIPGHHFEAFDPRNVGISNLSHNHLLICYRWRLCRTALLRLAKNSIKVIKI